MFGRLFKRNLAMLLVTTIAGIVLSFAAVISISLTTSIYYPIEMWLHAQDLFTLLYPLLCTIPFCWEICSERKNGFLKYVPNRAPLGRYLLYRYLGALIAISAMIFLSSFLSAVFAEKIISPAYSTLYGSIIGSKLWGDILVQAPLVYAFFLSLWRMVLAGLYFSFGFLLALWSKNSFLALTGPFIYSLLENYIMSILGMPSYSIATSFFIARMAPGATKPSDLLVGPAVLAIICIITLVYNVLKSNKGNKKCLDIV